MSPNTSPSGKRKSSLNIFQRATLGPLTALPDAGERKTLKKKGRFSSAFRVGAESPEAPRNKSKDDLTRLLDNGQALDSKSGSGSDPPSSRGTSSRRGKPPSLFGNLRNAKSNDGDTPPATASSVAPSFTWNDFGSPSDFTDIGNSRNVLHHGEAQTASNFFWKKKEYLVLTETHLVRFKNLQKAVEVFSSIQSSTQRATPLRHISTNSVDSVQESHSLNSDVSGEKAAGVALENIVAVYLPDDGRQTFSLEFSYLDTDATQSSSILLTFVDPEERDVWLRAIRQAANKARLLDPDPLPPIMAEYVARAVEREQDYDVMNFRMYKVVKRAVAKSSNRTTAEDSMKAASTVCFLVIGAHKVHLVHLPKSNLRGSASALTEMREGGSFGILTLTWISVSATDDAFSISFRLPFQKAKPFFLASLASPEIALELRERDAMLRPEWIQRPFVFKVPIDEDENPPPYDNVKVDDHNNFDHTLLAFCVSYNVNPVSIRYTIHEDVEDGPRFELLEPATSHDRNYSALELLAVMRSLRYNESFTSICFAKISLDVLNGLYDRYGVENVCTKSKHGVPLRLKVEEQNRAHVLIQEVRALAMGNKRLRRMDFSYCISQTSTEEAADTGFGQPSCGIVEALYPVCKQQITNVDWLYLNGIPLTEIDLEYLIGIAADKFCHIRAIETSRCGFTDRGVSLLLDALRAQSNTLEAIDLSNNTLRLVATSLSRQLDAFGFICKLDLSNLAVTTSLEPLLPLETLSLWRLQELRLSGIPLNSNTIEDICGYLAHSQSEVLRELDVSSCSLTGKDIGLFMEFMTIEVGTARLLHLDISGNGLQEHYEPLVRALSTNLAPTHLSMRAIEFDTEEIFRKLLLAVAVNKSIRYLDMAKISLPAGAGEETCMALEKVFAENQTLEDFDISGEDARLEVSRLGKGINKALNGLKYNETLEILRIKNQRLGLQGASKLADVLKENTTLRQLHCEHNDITLSGFTDLVNALANNTTLLYLPSLDEGRESALKQTEQQIKGAKIKPDEVNPTTASRISSVRRSFASRGPAKFTVSKVGAVPDWTPADIQAAMRLVNESWQKQVDRLHEFLERNWKISAGLPVDRNREDEEPQRPGTAASMSKLLERVRVESTPTTEKEVELGAPGSDNLGGSGDERSISPPGQAQADASARSPSQAATSEAVLLEDLAFEPDPLFEAQFSWPAPLAQNASTPSPSSSTAAVAAAAAEAKKPTSPLPPGSRSTTRSPHANRDKDLPPTPADFGLTLPERDKSSKAKEKD